MGTFFYTVPGPNQGNSITPRNIFTNWATAFYKNVPSWYQISGKLSRDPGNAVTTGNNNTLLRTGNMMGKITNTSSAYYGFYTPSVIGVIPSAGLNSATSLVLQPSVATYATDVINANGTSQNFIIVGPTTSGGTIISTTVSATSATTGTNASNSALILSSSLGVATAVGSVVLAGNGAGVPLTVLADNPFGIDVKDISGTTINQMMQTYLIGGDLISTMIPNLVADDFGVNVDPSVTAYLMGKLQANGQQFTFASNR